VITPDEHAVASCDGCPYGVDAVEWNQGVRCLHPSKGDDERRLDRYDFPDSPPAWCPLRRAPTLVMLAPVSEITDPGAAVARGMRFASLSVDLLVKWIEELGRDESSHTDGDHRGE
jgi:hypothetical protein